MEGRDSILTIVGFLDIMGLLHGIVLGLLLVYKRNKKQQPALFLGLYLIAIGCNFIPSILQHPYISESQHWLKLFPIRFYFLTEPLLYCYVLKMVLGKEAVLKKNHFVPAALEFGIFLILFLFPAEQKVDWLSQEMNNNLYRAYNLSANAFSIYYLIKIFSLIKKYHVKLNNFFVEVDGKLLLWIKKLVFISLFVIGFGSVFQLIPFIVSFNKTYLIIAFCAFILLNVLQLILIYWVSILGIRQVYAPFIFYREMERLEEDPIEEKVVVGKNDGDWDLLYSRILMEIINTECFKNINLTIIDLGYILDVHPKKISTVINAKGNMNFNAFINKFRVEEAKRLLSENGDARKLSVVGIGKEVGFKSSSAFYRAFKSIENVTPGNFR